MISQLEKKIALRYLRTRKKDGFLNLISIFSFIGITLGVAVLIVVMSVMNGFRSELINKIIGFNAHAVVKTYGDTIDKEKINKLKLEKISTKYIYSNTGEGVLIDKNYTKGLLIRGYSKDDFIKLDITNDEKFNGNKKLNIKHISIGKELSFNNEINVTVR